MLGLLERLAGVFLSILTLIALFFAGLVMFIPDSGRYLRIKRM
jgi:hypothetical protein